MRRPLEARRLLLAASTLLWIASATGALGQSRAVLEEKADPWVLDRLGRHPEVEVLVVLETQADLSPARAISERDERLRWVFETLRETARQGQASLRRDLETRGTFHRSFWVANMLLVRADEAELSAIAARPEVARLAGNPAMSQAIPWPSPLTNRGASPEAIEASISHIGAPELWNRGIDGAGIVVGGQDTGYDWDHPALLDSYRGAVGGPVDHDFNWHDAIHSGGGVCGADSAEPCDDHGHGTHTMGTMTGDDGGANQIGVAPGAHWIGCRNMDQGVGTPATYAECFQFFLAPTDLEGNNPNPTLAPHIINNSWSCPPSEGCNDPTILQKVVENVRAAGILVVVSAGNDGPGCSTVRNPAAIYDASFSVGATYTSDEIVGFSSRGPVTVDGSGRRKPDLVAPGVSIRSAAPGGGYSSASGTSMSGPHVAGAAALLMQAASCLEGDIDALEAELLAVTVPFATTQGCGGDGPDEVPNHTYGAGVLRVSVDFLDICARLFLDGFESGDLSRWTP